MNTAQGEDLASCQKCGAQLPEGARFCSSCASPVSSASNLTTGVPALQQRQSPIWYQNYYRIRKKVVAIANQYWIEDQQGTSLGYTKQKLLKLKEDIRVYTDESMNTELFRLQQEQIMDMWGTFAILDSGTNVCVGKLKRQAVMSGLVKDEYLLLDPGGRQVGRVVESAGRGLARKWVPGGALIPEHVAVEFNGREVAQIKQQFKIIGDIWEIDCSGVPAQFDRRTLLGCMIIMGMIERQRK
jgi:uncharacterized protein YxjI